MIKHIKCNMFDSGADIFCHQVNCQGEMNTGVATEVRKRYPWVFAEYKLFCDMMASPEDALGAYVQCFIDEERCVLNIFGQVEYDYDGNCYTDYEALKNAFEDISTNEEYFGKTLAFPYKMGCHRGGGDWDIVYKLIYDAFVDSKCDVLICEYDEEAEKERIRDRLLSIGKQMFYDDIDVDDLPSIESTTEKDDNIAFTFEVTKEEDKAINAWTKSHIFDKHQGHHYAGAIGGRYIYEFIPTSIGDIGTVRCSCGDEFTFRELE